MDATERLLAIEEIKQLKARCLRFVDTHDWDAYATVFTDDAMMDMTESGVDAPEERISRGRDTLVSFVSGVLEELQSAHFAHHPEIELLSPTEARGTWAMEETLWYPPGGEIRELHGYGHFHDTYEKVDGAWKISSLRLTRMRVDTVSS